MMHVTRDIPSATRISPREARDFESPRERYRRALVTSDDARADDSTIGPRILRGLLEHGRRDGGCPSGSPSALSVPSALAIFNRGSTLRDSFTFVRNYYVCPRTETTGGQLLSSHELRQELLTACLRLPADFTQTRVENPGLGYVCESSPLRKLFSIGVLDRVIIAKTPFYRPSAFGLKVWDAGDFKTSFAWNAFCKYAGIRTA